MKIEDFRSMPGCLYWKKRVVQP